MIREIDGRYIADTARILGEVSLGERVSVWYSAAIRGDVARIEIGDESNIQDNVTIHCDTGKPNHIGKRVTIGHNAVVHGLEVGDGSLIGMNATVLGDTRIGKNCLIAAGAVVTPGTVVPDGHVVMGTPGKIVRETNDREKDYLSWLWERYVELSQAHVADPTGPRFKPWSGVV
jgi:carbonic anhydrase/acetyltransferase-like protein (isoleucine patch superfamily)